MPRSNNEIKEKAHHYIDQKISDLSKSLLDTSSRNPLVSTKITDRSVRLIRIIDELPKTLIDKLTASEEMEIISLPPIEEESLEEETTEFQNEVAAARLTDETYLNSLEKLDNSTESTIDALNKIDRELKDRVRSKLNMAPQASQNKKIAWEEHAKKHGILPSYDLPAKENCDDNRHSDNKIQTPVHANSIEKLLNSISDKERTFREEKGINVLHVAVGFLEWQDDKSEKIHFSPLILLPVKMIRSRTGKGFKFKIQSDGDIINNECLIQKLKHEFNVELDNYENDNIEEYFDRISAQKPLSNIKLWNVKRWSIIGLFPSQNIAMYRDLLANREEICMHDIICQMIGGSNKEYDDVGELYDIDSPEVEKILPYLVDNADSSQHNAIIDVANGSNLALEGPPGTGKSQTIVNTIAAFLAMGKKVLFVAEKSAALNVVKARLDALDIGDFVLPLQANSTKAEIISSIKQRADIKRCIAPKNLQEEIQKFRDARDQHQYYLDILKSEWADTGFTVFDIYGKNIKHHTVMDNLNPNNIRIDNTNKITQQKLDDSKVLCDSLERLFIEKNQHKDYWQHTTNNNTDKFTIDSILQQAEDIAQTLDVLSALTQNHSMNLDVSFEHLESDFKTLSCALNKLPKNIGYEIKKIIADCTNLDGLIGTTSNFLEDINTYQYLKENLKQYIAAEFNPKTLHQLESLKKIQTLLIKKYNITKYCNDEIQHCIDSKQAELKQILYLKELYTDLSAIFEHFSNISTVCLHEIAEITSLTSREGLKVRNIELQQCNTTMVKKAVQDMHSLKIRWDTISLNFNIKSQKLPEAQILSNCIAILKDRGFFSKLRSEYRAATKYSKSILNNNPSSIEQTINFLTDLSEYVEDYNIFVSKDIIKAFGMYFDGLDTKLHLFEEVLQLFENIDSLLIKHNISGELGEILKYGDTIIIEKIKAALAPSIEALKSHTKITNLQHLHERIDILGQEIQDLENALDNLNSENILRSPEAFLMIGKIENEFREYLATKDIIQSNAKIKTILGSKFQAEDTSIGIIEILLSYAKALKPLEQDKREIINNLNKDHEISKLIDTIDIAEDAISSFRQKFPTFKDRTGIDINLLPKTVLSIKDYLFEAAQDKEGLNFYSKIADIIIKIKDEGYDNFIDAVTSGHIDDKFSIYLEAIIFRDMMSSVYSQYEKLKNYNGQKLSNLRNNIKEKDKSIQILARTQLKHELLRGAKYNIPQGNGIGRKDTYTEYSLVKNEINKKKNHIPIRKLVERATKTLQELKPCWMMSPLAIAEYLSPFDKLNQFDLVIIDEASQMTPENAIGALLRGKQTMIVGDTNQLPPTNFFKTISDDIEDDDSEEIKLESILESANIALPRRILNWHYRSEHQELIAFCNHHIYQNKLISFPSNNTKKFNQVVEYIKVEGLYHSGTNPEEAKYMVKKISQFMLENPDQSLGVVLLNKKQTELLQDELNILKNEKHIWNYIKKWEDDRNGLEAFFIKNLENVQGDERDVIFIGTIYGPEKQGLPVKQRFGPVNGDVGKRRLNVLFSRAKKRVVTFSSMTADNIKAEADHNPGSFMLKSWLGYAATGMLYESNGQYNQEPESEFEEHVIEQIRYMGFEAIPQIGTQGYRIDIGIKHPNWKHGYLMGVECDGATYHSSKSARDRDRLRQEVLEDKGWHLYRIWSTDWFNNPVLECKKLKTAINNRLDALLKIHTEDKYREIVKVEQVQIDTKPANEQDNIEEVA